LYFTKIKSKKGENKMPLTCQQKKLVRKARNKNAKFYFIIDADNLPRGTVCLVKEQNIVSRGIALCSMKTSLPDPLEGCFFAWKCAMRAMSKGTDSHEILRPEAYEVIDNFKSKLWRDFNYRSMFDVLPANGVEEKLFKKLSAETNVSAAA
jgi:hypothetical protein